MIMIMILIITRAIRMPSKLISSKTSQNPLKVKSIQNQFSICAHHNRKVEKSVEVVKQTKLSPVNALQYMPHPSIQSKP